MNESLEKEVVDWTNNDVLNWLRNEDLYDDMKDFCVFEELDGKCLLSLVEQDFYNPPFSALTLRKRKRFTFSLRKLQNSNKKLMHSIGLSNDNGAKNLIWDNDCFRNSRVILSPHSEYDNHFYESDPSSIEIKASSLKPEIFKAFVSMCYVFLVTWVTAVVMVIVHDKVPDMKKYPPLPDLFLDNVPHIPWAFDMCEITGSILMAIWVTVLLFHKQRFIIMRRFFALAGTVFLLRCITMLITSLSVPGSHLKCAPRSYPSADELSHWGRRLQQAYEIWSGAGMSVRGVRTCGDYMFSGHTVILTLLNFFITEYTSRSLYLLHIITWVMNMFGIFFILAAHEHYSIDVFIAFYITSRLFLYYHTLSNNQAIMRGDSMRTKIWFPLLTYFESDVNGIVPNEYESPLVLLRTARDSLLQSLHGLYKSSTVKMVNTKLSDGADQAVFKFVDGIKNHIIVTSTLSRLASRNLQDKDIQVCLPEDMCIEENIPTTVKKKIS